jgi:hypothetical protein
MGRVALVKECNNAGIDIKKKYIHEARKHVNEYVNYVFKKQVKSLKDVQSRTKTT